MLFSSVKTALVWLLYFVLQGWTNQLRWQVSHESTRVNCSIVKAFDIGIDQVNQTCGSSPFPVRNRTIQQRNVSLFSNETCFDQCKKCILNENTLNMKPESDYFTILPDYFLIVRVFQTIEKPENDNNFG